jgi:hypothetical protein
MLGINRGKGIWITVVLGEETLLILVHLLA